jgi:hypothetical protein
LGKRCRKEESKYEKLQPIHALNQIREF